MLKADLHIHSTFSDGSETISQLIKIAKSNQIDVISITDHDTITHIKNIPKTENIKVIAGIEISAIDKTKNKKAHILGYDIKNFEIIEKLTLPLLQRRHENSLLQIEKLVENGYSIDLDKINRADGKYIYKQHIMEHLYKTCQVYEMFGEFYNNVFKNGGICDFDIEYIDVYKAVKAIKLSGGKAVLAHSGLQKNFYLIPDLVSIGLDGLECNHPSNDKEDREIIKKYAKEHNLFLTGGSDYHGKFEKDIIEIGECLCNESGVLALC